MSEKTSVLALVVVLGLGCSFPEYEFPADAALVDGASADASLDAPLDDAPVEAPVDDASLDSPEDAREVAVDASGETCSNPAAPNRCGGCAVLGGEPGKECNVGTQCPGTWKCDGTERVTCEDGHAFNGCGTCTAMANKPTDPCGACGNYECSADKSTLVCKEAVPLDKTSCGLGCSTSQYVCRATTPRTTECVRPDEAVLVDTDNTTNNTDANGLCNEYRKAVSFSVQHRGQINKLSVSMSRRACGCEVCGSVRGDVVVTVYRGTPRAPGAVIGTGRLADGAIVDGWNDFTITGSPVLAAGDPIYFELRYVGNFYSFAFDSSTAWKAGQVPWFLRTSQTEWSYELNFRLWMLACTK